MLRTVGVFSSVKDLKSVVLLNRSITGLSNQDSQMVQGNSDRDVGFGSS